MSTPTPELDPRYSDDGAAATPWRDVEQLLATAQLYWLASVRPEGGPHQTPLIGLYVDGALHFTTGPRERKARNIAANDKVLMSTGANTLHAGCDVAVEGRARRVTDEARLAVLAAQLEAKYGPEWHFDVADGAFAHPGGSGVAHVFRLEATRAYAFTKDPYAHTRFTFG
jgi:nitroimidazol reductase NimA-like FMN-containing flavoprotein (pyridoxamine 5'-phosphate oxidase superfamily)